MSLFWSCKGVRMFNHLLFIASPSLTQLISCAAAVRRTPASMGDLLAPWDAPEGPMCPSQAEWKVQDFVAWLVLVLSSKRNFRYPTWALFLTVTIQLLFISHIFIFRLADLSLLILSQLVWTGSSNVLSTWSSPVIKSNQSNNLFLTLWSFGEEINGLLHPRTPGFNYHRKSLHLAC